MTEEIKGENGLTITEGLMEEAQKSALNIVEHSLVTIRFCEEVVMKLNEYGDEWGQMDFVVMACEKAIESARYGYYACKDLETDARGSDWLRVDAYDKYVDAWNSYRETMRMAKGIDIPTVDRDSWDKYAINCGHDDAAEWSDDLMADWAEAELEAECDSRVKSDEITDDMRDWLIDQQR